VVTGLPSWSAGTRSMCGMTRLGRRGHGSLWWKTGLGFSITKSKAPSVQPADLLSFLAHETIPGTDAVNSTYHPRVDVRFTAPAKLFSSFSWSECFAQSSSDARHSDVAAQARCIRFIVCFSLFEYLDRITK
jgi:hypothetical protein